MFVFCPVRDQLPKHYKDNLLHAKIKYVLFVYKAPGSGMARGELRSTLSRAGPCRCSALFLPTENPWDIKTVFFAE